MNRSIKIGEKYQNIENVYRKLIRMSEKRSFNLVDDGHLKKQIMENYSRIQMKMDLQMTVCAVFDTRNSKTRLIDGLIKECISKHLETNFAYILQGAGSNQTKMTNLNEKEIKTVYTHVNKWKSLENSCVILSSDEYLSFLNNLKVKHTIFPDVIILVLKSPMELNEEKVKSFITEVGKEYHDKNFFLVFNDAAAQDCTSIEDCDKCYPEKLKAFLSTTDIKWEKRIFKVSTLRNFENNEFENIKVDPNSNTFKELRQILDKELDINTVMERLNQAALEVYSAMSSIRKTFDEKTIKESINRYEVKLKEKSEFLFEKIDSYESKAVEDMMKKENNSNKDILNNLYYLYNGFEDSFKKELVNLEGSLKNKDYDEKVGVMANEMFLNEYLKKDEMKSKIKDIVEENFQNFDPEDFNKKNNTDIEDPSEKTNFENCVISATNKIFEIAKEAFKTFLEVFKGKATKDVEEMNESVKEIVNEFVKLKCSSDLSHHIKEVKAIINNKTRLIKNNLEVSVVNLMSMISEGHDCQICWKNLIHSVTEIVNKFGIGAQMKNIKKEINFYMGSIPSNEVSKVVFRTKCRMILKAKDVEQCSNKCDKRVLTFLKSIKDKKYNQSNIPGKLNSKSILKEEINDLKSDILNIINEANKVLNDTINKVSDEQTQ